MRARDRRFDSIKDDSARHVLQVADRAFVELFDEDRWKDCRTLLEETPGLFEVVEPWRRVWYAMTEMSLQEIRDSVARGHLDAVAIPGTNTDLMCKAAGKGRLDAMQWLWSERQTFGYVLAGLPHALQEACAYGHVEPVRWLLDLGVPAGGRAVFSAEPRNFQFGDLPLFAACHKGCRDVIELLLERGADPNAVDRTGCPPIVMAAKHGRRAVEPLLRAGVDLDAHEQDGELNLGALSLSFGEHVEGGEENFEYLLSAGANPLKHPDALLCAASRGGSYAIAKRLLDLGVDVNHRGFRARESALMLASKKGDGELVALLLERGADPNLVDNEGRTALVYAASEGMMDVVERLIAAGATPECVQGPRSFWQHIAKQSPAFKRQIRAKILAQTMEDAMKGPAADPQSKPGSGGGMGPL